MKRIGVIILFAVMTSVFAAAQKYAFVDSEYIRKNIPAFNKAQEQLETFPNNGRKRLPTGMRLLNRCTNLIRMM